MKISEILKENRTFVSGRDFDLEPNSQYKGYFLGADDVGDDEVRKTNYSIYKFSKETEFEHNGKKYKQKHYELIQPLKLSPYAKRNEVNTAFKSAVDALSGGKEDLDEMWPLTKKDEKFEPNRYPGSDEDLTKWMIAKIKNYKETGKDPARFFSPTCIEYFPMQLQVGGEYTGKAIAAYHFIKQKFPEMVKRAKMVYTQPLPAHIVKNRGGDKEDFIVTEDAQQLPSAATHATRVNNIVNNLKAQGHTVLGQDHSTTDNAHKSNIQYLPKKKGFFSAKPEPKNIDVNTQRSDYVAPTPEKIVGNVDRRAVRGNEPGQQANTQGIHEARKNHKVHIISTKMNK